MIINVSEILGTDSLFESRHKINRNNVILRDAIEELYRTFFADDDAGDLKKLEVQSVASNELKIEDTLGTPIITANEGGVQINESFLVNDAPMFFTSSARLVDNSIFYITPDTRSQSVIVDFAITCDTNTTILELRQDVNDTTSVYTVLNPEDNSVKGFTKEILNFNVKDVVIRVPRDIANINSQIPENKYISYSVPPFKAITVRYVRNSFSNDFRWFAVGGEFNEIN